MQLDAINSVNFDIYSKRCLMHFDLWTDQHTYDAPNSDRMLLKDHKMFLLMTRTAAHIAGTLLRVHHFSLYIVQTIFEIQ